MTTALPAEIDAVLRDPAWAAARCGRRVVAFMSNNVPIELIHAAGCFPFQLPTAPRGRTPRADRYLEARFDPLVRVALEQLLSGEQAGASLLILPRSVDAMQRLYYYLCELRRSFGEQVPEPFLYDVLHTPWYSSATYDYARTAALKQRLERLTGCLVDDDALRASIRLYNGVRARIARLVALRRAVPCALSAERARAVFMASQRIAPERLCELLDEALAAAPESAAGVRTLLVGSAHDTAALHRAIAEAGGQIVADHHWLGEPLFGPPVDEQLAPLQAITSHYHRDSPSSRSFPSDPSAVVRVARDAGAEAAVFFYYAEEEALTWDYPEQQRALLEIGVPVLQLAKQAYPPDPSIAPTLRAFFEAAQQRGVRRMVERA